MKSKSINTIVRIIVFFGVMLAFAGGYYAYLVNQH